MGGKNKPGYKPPKLKFARDRKKYDRQPDETDKTWRAFCLYKELGYGRTLRGAAQLYIEQNRLKGALRTVEGNFSKWSNRYRWRERIVDWDNHIDTKRRRGQENALLSMREKHTKLGESLQVAGAKALTAWMRNKEGIGYLDVDMSDIVKAIKVGIDIERKGREQPDLVIEQKMTVKQERIRDRMQHLLDEEKFGPAVDILMKATNETPSSEVPN